MSGAIVRVAPPPVPSGAAGVWQLRASRRARRLAVRVLPGGVVEVVVPRGTRRGAIERFVAGHRRWIEHKVAQYRPLDGAGAEVLPDVIAFAASGRRFKVRYRPAPGGPWLAVQGEEIRIGGDLSRIARVRHLLQRFTMREARDALGTRLATLSRASGLRYARFQVRRQRTRWGSCSRSGAISLNACLLFQPPEVADYLLVHELAHTRHMNHSPRFWSLVNRIEPRWRALDAALMQGWRLVPAWALG